MIAESIAEIIKIDKQDKEFVIHFSDELCIDSYIINYMFFCILSEKWKDETKYLSFTKDIYNSDSYKRIVKLGSSVLPFIFKELEKEPNHWFHALRTITNENPVKENSKGNVKLMSNDWITWAKQRAII